MTIRALCDQLTLVAAYCHDVGKLNKAFQAKLQRTIAGAEGLALAEFVRHDAMSYWILRKLMSNAGLAGLLDLTALPGEQLQLLIHVGSAAELKTGLQAYLHADLTMLSTVLSGAPTNAADQGCLADVAAALVAFLSLTHHKLPGTFKTADIETYRYLDSFSANCYVHDQLAGDFKDCLAIPDNVFQSDAGLATGLATELARLQTLVRTEANIDLKQLVSACLLHGRPTMVLGDHLASGLKSFAKAAAGEQLANLRTVNRGCVEAREPGDSLTTHVKSVVAHTRVQLSAAAALIQGDLAGFPTLSERARSNIAALRSPHGPFAWQHEAHAHLKEHARGLPSLLLVTAGTGAGKTILSAQAMDALGSQRYTYALGLRSLTLQTGQSYQEDLGLQDQDLAVVIGDQAAKKAFETANGSESAAQDQLVVLTKGALAANWMTDTLALAPGHCVSTAISASDSSFISTPVVVCTVDQLIGITQLRTVRKAMRLKRIQSADLILDEVDNYSPEELKQLAKLCFATGYARKNLVCLSATMGLIHVQALYDAFRAGLALNDALTGAGAEIFVGSISNSAPPAHLVVNAADPVDAVLAYTMAFNDLVIATQAAMPSKAIAKVLPATAANHGAILAEALCLHDLHGVDIDGARVSAGFIRMTTVSSARQLSRFLLEASELPDDTEISVVTYHSRFSALELSSLDRILNKLTNRKRLQPGMAFSQAAMDDIIRPLIAAAPGKRNYVIVVVTTSIIEAGRDVDFDWSVLEPSSIRSLIQAGGRVRRHRQANGLPNVSVIEHPARALHPVSKAPVQTNPVRVFSMPGPFTELSKTNTSWEYTVKRAAKAMGACVRANAHDCQAQGLLNLFDAGAVRSAAALVAPSKVSNAFQCVEQSVLHTALLQGSSVPTMRPLPLSSAADQRQHSLLLTDWAYQRGFRAEDGNTLAPVFIAFQQKGAGDMTLCSTPVTTSGEKSIVASEQVVLAGPWRYLPKVVSGGGLDTELANLANVLSPHELQSLVKYEHHSYSASRDLFYHPSLGFDSRPA